MDEKKTKSEIWNEIKEEARRRWVANRQAYSVADYPGFEGWSSAYARQREIENAQREVCRERGYSWEYFG